MVKRNYEVITNSDSFHKIDISKPLKITWKVTNQKKFNEAYAKYFTNTKQISNEETQVLELKIQKINNNSIYYDYTKHAGLENFFSSVWFEIGSRKIKFSTQPAFNYTTEITKVEAVLKEIGGGKRKNTQTSPGEVGVLRIERVKVKVKAKERIPKLRPGEVGVLRTEKVKVKVKAKAEVQEEIRIRGVRKVARVSHNYYYDYLIDPR